MHSTALRRPATGWLVENGPRELELLFRAILYSPSVPILVVDNDHICLDTNAGDRKSTRLNSSHIQKSRMPSSA